MKKYFGKLIGCVLATILMFALAACGQQSSQQSQASSESQTVQNSNEETPVSSEIEEMSQTSSSSEESSDTAETKNEGSKTLVVYFSASGNTEAVAETITETLDAELYELVPETPYTEADLDWNTPGSRVNAEHKDPSFRTAIAGEAMDLSGYDTILIGYPLWWREAPSIVRNFVENSDLAGKTVIPFCTSMSDGFGSSGDTLAAMAPGATWMTGQRFGESPDAATVAQWVNGLGIAE